MAGGGGLWEAFTLWTPESYSSLPPASNTVPAGSLYTLTILLWEPQRAAGPSAEAPVESAWVGSLTPTLLARSYIFAATCEGGRILRQGCFLQPGSYRQVLVGMLAITLNL